MAANLEWSLAVIAVLISLGSPGPLTVHLLPGGHLAITALRLALAAAVLVNLHAFLTMRHALSAATLLAAMVCVLLGPTPAEVIENLRLMAVMLLEFIARSIPRTRGEWGIAAVGSAFALLVIGAGVSLRRPHRVQAVTDEG